MTSPASPPDLKRVLKTVFIMVFLMFAMIYGIGIVGMFIASFIDNYYVYEGFSFFLNILEAVVGGVVAISYGANALHLDVRKLFDFRQFSWEWFGKGVSMHYAASFVGNLILIFINLALAFFNTEIEDVILESSNFLIYIMNFITVVVASICEEIVFRGLICTALSRYNRGFAVVVSALLFASAHMNLDQGLPAFIIGISLGFIYLRSGSLLITIAIHAVNNFIAITVTAVQNVFFVTILSVFALALVAIGFYYWFKERNELDAMLRLCGRARKEWGEFVHCKWFWVWIVLFFLLAIVPVIFAVFVYII